MDFKFLSEFVTNILSHLTSEGFIKVMDKLGVAWEKMPAEEKKRVKFQVFGRLDLEDENLFERAEAELRDEDLDVVNNVEKKLSKLPTKMQDYYRLCLVGLIDPSKTKDENDTARMGYIKSAMRAHADMTDTQWSRHVEIMNYDLVKSTSRFRHLRYKMWRRLLRLGWIKGTAFALLLWFLIKGDPEHIGKTISTLRSWSVGGGQSVWSSITTAFSAGGKALGATLKGVTTTTTRLGRFFLTLLGNAIALTFFLLGLTLLLFLTGTVSPWVLVLAGAAIVFAWLAFRADPGPWRGSLYLTAFTLTGATIYFVGSTVWRGAFTVLLAIVIWAAARLWTGWKLKTLGYMVATVLLLSAFLPTNARIWLNDYAGVGRSRASSSWRSFKAATGLGNVNRDRESLRTEAEAADTVAILEEDSPLYVVNFQPDGTTTADYKQVRGEVLVIPACTEVKTWYNRPKLVHHGESLLEVVLGDAYGQYVLSGERLFIPEKVTPKLTGPVQAKGDACSGLDPDQQYVLGQTARNLRRTGVRWGIEQISAAAVAAATPDENGNLPPPEESLEKIRKAQRLLFQIDEVGRELVKPPKAQPAASTQPSGSTACFTNAPAEYVAIVDRYLQQFPTVPRNLVLGVIAAESNWDPRAVSSRGAQGLMQLMPGTAQQLGVNDPFDPDQNIGGGVQYLAEQLEKFQSTDLALAAYNWGPENIERYPGQSWAQIAPNAPAETQEYVAKVIALARRECRPENQTLTAGGTQPPATTPEPLPQNVNCNFAGGASSKVRVDNTSDEAVRVYLVNQGDCREQLVTPSRGQELRTRAALGFTAQVGQPIVIRSRTGRIIKVDQGPARAKFGRIHVVYVNGA